MKSAWVSVAPLFLIVALGCGAGQDGGPPRGGGAPQNPANQDSANPSSANPNPKNPNPKNQGQAPPVFILAWSEYPSWSVFGVAHERGLLNKEQGAQGEIEKKWGVDIVLQQADYDPCLSMFGGGQVDAVCITNMDSLAPSLGRDAVAILPTSTSVGADACIAVGIEDAASLAGKPTFGLEKSVSQYAFERCLEKLGLDSSKYTFKNMDPGTAATAMQSDDAAVQSIMVWNPFVLQTLRDREGSKRLFDSSSIPEEIIDMVVVGKESLAKPGGEDFACAVIDAFYRFNELLADPAQGDDALVALGAKFSSLGLDDMKVVVQETRFYRTPEEALALLGSDMFQKETMPRVVDFCVSHDIVEQKPSIGFNDPSAQFNIDDAYIKKVQAKSPAQAP